MSSNAITLGSMFRMAELALPFSSRAQKLQELKRLNQKASDHRKDKQRFDELADTASRLFEMLKTMPLSMCRALTEHPLGRAFCGHQEDTVVSEQLAEDNKQLIELLLTPEASQG
jgi:hypothetical protein